MRVTLRDGMSAELRDRITHAADKAIKRAYRVDALDAQDELIRQFVTAWDVRDNQGQPVPLGDVDNAPDDIVDTLFDEASALYKGNTEPGAPYAKLIGRLVLGQKVGTSEVEALPDPETFKDALLLATVDLRLSPSELDEMDALLLALVERLRKTKKG